MEHTTVAASSSSSTLVSSSSRNHVVEHSISSTRSNKRRGLIAATIHHCRTFGFTVLLSTLVFGVLTTAALVLYLTSVQAHADEAQQDAVELAHQVGQRIEDKLNHAVLLPVVTLAHFAVELDIFKTLPARIGPVHNASTTNNSDEASLPYLRLPNGTTTFTRNVTTVCDDRQLVERYQQIQRTIQTNTGVGGILRNLQLAPAGVICLSHGELELSASVGWDILNNPKFAAGVRATLRQEEAVLIGPMTLLACPTCGPHFAVRYPIPSSTYDLRDNAGNVYPHRWGVTAAVLDWTALLEKSQIRQHVASYKDCRHEFQLVRTENVYNHQVAYTILAQSDGYTDDAIDDDDHLNQVSAPVDTVNGAWEVRIQYEKTDKNALFCVVLVLSVLGPLLIAVLLHIALVQKQVHAAMRAQAIAQEAKLDVERNMTAYFAHGEYLYTTKGEALVCKVYACVMFDNGPHSSRPVYAELRNPLGAIDSALSSMPDDLHPETQELVSGMQLCSGFMSNIMNNLLDVRMLEEGQIKLRRDPLSLQALVGNVQSMCLPTVRPNVELQVVVETTPGNDWVLGDIHRMQQILNNICSSAAKYTVTGSITLVVGWEGNLVRLECKDTGPGIPIEEQKQLFQRFVRRGGAPGSGLGLAIAKQIVDFMGGSIHFESDPAIRAGANCIVLLPLPACQETPSNTSPFDMVCADDDVPIDKTFSILLVDDIKMNRRMLQRRLQKSIAPNCVISEAETGEEAIARCKKNFFDIIIMDQYMEGAGGIMVGTDVVASLRRDKTASFIIGCSGNDLSDSFLAAGADVVWGKPLPSNEVIRKQLREALINRESV